MAKPSVPLPTTEYLHECFAYDPETGTLTWKVRPRHHFASDDYWQRWNKTHAGKAVGSPSPRYLNTAIKGKRLMVHRLVWKMQTGEWPPQIDHKNCNGLDNRWENLRLATHQENKWNRSRPYRDLPRGVTMTKTGRYQAILYTSENGKYRRPKYLGYFDTPEEAHAVWLAYVSKMRGEFFRAD